MVLMFYSHLQESFNVLTFRLIKFKFPGFFALTDVSGARSETWRDFVLFFFNMVLVSIVSSQFIPSVRVVQ